MAHGLETILDAASAIQNSHPEILFLFVGEGADKQRVISIAASRKLENVRFVGEQPRERVPSYIRSSDVCLVLLKDSEIFKTVIPTKLLEFMACARPVILGVDGQARQVMNAAQAGIFIRPGNATDLSEALIRLSEDCGLASSLGRNGRKYILQNLSRAQTARDYEEVLSTCWGEVLNEIAPLHDKR